MAANNHYDVCIIGGGLAGLSAAIQLKKLGYKVALFEKEKYPFHKVCGEYISLESWNFIESLGVGLSNLNLPIIKKLIVTAPGGNSLSAPLRLGGFGISRYLLDNELRKIAVESGVSFYEGCKVKAALFTNNIFNIETTQGIFTAGICCGSFGKRSNLDVKLKRGFIAEKPNKLNNYIGVKYHIKISHPADTIALHNFKNGYCGISKVEGDTYCLCYLTNAANLKENDNSIVAMEKNVLHKNIHLKKIWEESTFVYSQPLIISQISFAGKSQIKDHILMLGDAAGMITPLCGNGMSMALHSSKIASGHIQRYLSKKINRNEMETGYQKEWILQFESRVSMGRMIQRLFGKKWMTDIFVSVMKKMPSFTQQLIRRTHGHPF